LVTTFVIRTRDRLGQWRDRRQDRADRSVRRDRDRDTQQIADSLLAPRTTSPDRSRLGALALMADSLLAEQFSGSRGRGGLGVTDVTS
jgi:hypothetical protein